MASLRSPNSIRVSVNASSGVISSATPVTVKNISTISGGIFRLDQLSDVNARNETDKATLVYDASTDKYIVKNLEFGDISGDLDGGTF